MGVCPMAPFPGNDHAIPPSPVALAYYNSYGGLFRAVAANVWALLPHIVSVVNGTSQGTSYAKVNAFIVPDNSSEAGISLVMPVVMAAPANGSVALNVTGADRVWSGGSNGGAYRHPAVGSLLSSIPDGASAEYVYSVQWAGGSGVWEPLLVTANSSTIVSVPLPLSCAGAAVVRLQQRLVLLAALSSAGLVPAKTE